MNKKYILYYLLDCFIVVVKKVKLILGLRNPKKSLGYFKNLVPYVNVAKIIFYSCFHENQLPYFWMVCTPFKESKC